MVDFTKANITYWTQKFKQWLEQQFDAVASSIDFSTVNAKIDAMDEKVTPYLYDPCTVEDIDHMFESVTDGDLIIVPSGLIGPDGTMPVAVFKAVTGLTPTE